MMLSLPKVIEAYRMFAQEEKHKEIFETNSHIESIAEEKQSYILASFQIHHTPSTFQNTSTCP